MRLPLCLRRLERVAGATGDPSLLALGVRLGHLLLGWWALGLRVGSRGRRCGLRQPCRWSPATAAAITLATAAWSTAASTAGTAAANRHRSQRWPR